MTYLLYLVIRSLRREKKNDEKFKKELNRKFENILKRKMKSRRRKFKKALIIENSTEVYNTNEGSLIMSTTVPETTTQHKIDENWYSYVDFLRENDVG